MPFTNLKTLPLDRRRAGEALAALLNDYAKREDVVVLALPRGGIVIGVEIAKQLQAPLALMLVQKLALARKENVAIGAVASGGLRYVNRTITRELGITDEAIETAMHKASAELFLRQRMYTGAPGMPDLHDKVVVLADDGMISGSTMYLACCAVRRGGAREVIVAVPVISRISSAKLARAADRVVSVMELQQFEPLNGWYFSERPTDREAATTLNDFLSKRNVDPANGDPGEREKDPITASD